MQEEGAGYPRSGRVSVERCGKGVMRGVTADCICKNVPVVYTRRWVTACLSFIFICLEIYIFQRFHSGPTVSFWGDGFILG